MFKKLLLTILTLLFCQTALAGVITNSPLDTAAFWTSRTPHGDEVILTPAQIKSFNQKIYQATPTSFDLAALPDRINRSVFMNALTDYSAISATVYRNGTKVEQDYKNNLMANVNANQVPAQVKIRYGVITRHCNMRVLPTEDGLFDEPDDIYYDDLQDTTLEIGEPVVIYHASRDGLFYYVQMHNYQGWVKAENIALAPRSKWLKYVQPERFLLVIGKDYSLPRAGEGLYCQMGTRLPLTGVSDAGYTVTVPARNPQGRLQENQVTLKKSAALHKGYLPYTTNNIFRQAFKFYGNVYGWGGLLHSVDCSSLIYDVYRTMGIYLPRNAKEQRDTAGIGTKVEGFTEKQRLAALETLPPGSSIHLGGTHAMIYLGMVDHVPYVIHSASSYIEGNQKIYIRQVLVSDLNLHKKHNQTFLSLSNKYMTFR